MALSASRLASAIKSAVDGVTGVQVVGAGNVNAYRTALYTAIATAIVNEITTNAVVHTVDSHGDTCNNGTIT